MFKNIPTRSIIAILFIGVLLGFAVLAGFGTFVHYTSTNRFCATTCHEMRMVAEEYRESPFYKNTRGLRVGCADCHVPKPVVAKLWRKLSATRELYHKAMGSIDTPEKFETKRLTLARNEWQRLKESDSRECRNCHLYEAMAIDGQPNNARFWHPAAVDEGYTCIDCHKGFVHRMPDLEAQIEKAAQRFQAVLAADTLTTDRLYTVKATVLYFGPSPEDPIIAQLEPATPVTVLQRDSDRFRVRIRGRQYQTNVHTLYGDDDKMVALLRTRGEPVTVDKDTTRSGTTGLSWNFGQMEGWVSPDTLISRIGALWDYGKVLHENECVRCHVVFSPSDFWSTQWKHEIQNMRRKTDLIAEDMDILLKYLQYKAKPQGTI
uniref:Cytochrome c-type protein n=1 Tax=Candidatus Kentrum sp. FM TaxID=2126340 RepID=A0A450RYM9_9GAMM|nr:MAG: trimethylamine-N-oxide reductase (cytochrome c), cytochrome c-type subunit TorC [Candidatus Kentron sp. FM]VFJ61842.1 MAG: trimethylamine-N-oxide reductase (cytochrome c), cytochrome c-type subunit TorC [Candidatus Kentron sp. FM]VFK06510.1 MAG: trimethylamine-N-oxide reductase (cytochrome c), cytochrome c-type subunit TorC [Candidatus Kentron sp. FM]